MFNVLLFNEEERNHLVARMASDIKYYLGYGHRVRKCLWANDERKQVEYMFTLLLSIENNISGITIEDVNRFADEMGVSVWTRFELYGRWVKNGVAFYIFRKWGDEKGDRLECYTCLVGQENKAKLFASAKNYVYPLDFLLYCQYNYKF